MDSPATDSDGWRALKTVLRPGDTFEITPEVQQCVDVLVGSLCETAVRESEAFVRMGHSSTEAASLVAIAMLRAAWGNVAITKIEAGGVPRADLFLLAAQRATEVFDFSDLIAKG